MKRIGLLLIFLSATLFSFSQTKGYLRYDSLFVEKAGGKTKVSVKGNATVQDTLSVGKAGMFRVDSVGKVIINGTNVGRTGGSQGNFPLSVYSLNDSSVTEATATNGIRSDVIYNDQIHNSWYTRYNYANTFNQHFSFRAKRSVQIQNNWTAGIYGWANVNATKSFKFGDSTSIWLRSNNILEPTPNFYSDVTMESVSSVNRMKHLTFSMAGYLSWARMHYTSDTIGAFYNFMAASPASNANGTKFLNYYGFYAGTGPSTAAKSWGFYSDGANDNNYFAGKVLVGDNSILNADIHKLHIAGSSKFAGNIVQSSGRTMLGGAVDDGSSALQVNGNIGFSATTIDSTKGVISQNGKRIYSSYGTDNYFLGQSGNFSLASTDNIAFGNYSFRMATTAGKNVVIGSYCLDSLQSGNANVAIGYKTLGRVKAGRNVGVGYEVFRSLSDASSDNTGVGVWAMEYLQSGSRNTGVGEDVGANMSTGSDNTFLGYRAAGNSFQNATLNGVIAIGTNHLITGITSNTTIIGNGINTSRSNVAIIGNSSQLLSLGKVPDEYADNAAAKVAGLVNGDIYRTGDLLKIVHD